MNADFEDEARERVASSVSRETFQTLERYTALLDRWTRRINLVGRNELPRLWSRHILDSLGLLDALPNEGACVDIGSGGGFPAIPLAIVSRETKPEIRFHLIESDGRKAAFLREAVRSLGLRAEVEAVRVADSRVAQPRIISARALAAVPELLSWCENWLSEGAEMVLLKGENAHDELTAASAQWHMRYQAERHPLTLKGYMLIIREAKRAEHS